MMVHVHMHEWSFASTITIIDLFELQKAVWDAGGLQKIEMLMANLNVLLLRKVILIQHGLFAAEFLIGFFIS